MDKEQIDNLIEFILDNVKNEGKTFKVLEKGFMDISMLFDDLSEIVEIRDLPEYTMSEIFKKDEQIVKEVKKLLITFLKKELEKELPKVFKQMEDEENSSYYD